MTNYTHPCKKTKSLRDIFSSTDLYLGQKTAWKCGSFSRFVAPCQQSFTYEAGRKRETTVTQMRMPHFLRTMWRHLAEATAHTWAAALAFKESQRLQSQRPETKSEMPLTWRRLQAHKHRSVSARLIGRDPCCRQLAAFTYWERVSEWVCLLATAARQGRLTRLQGPRVYTRAWSAAEWGRGG